MTDDPGSLRPLTDSLVGGFLSILFITAPLGAVATNTNNNVPYLQQSGVHLLRQTDSPDVSTRYPSHEIDFGGGLHN